MTHKTCYIYVICYTAREDIFYPGKYLDMRRSGTLRSRKKKKGVRIVEDETEKLSDQEPLPYFF